MTALAAVWHQHEPERAEPDCACLLAAQAYLGPDGCALHATTNLALGRQLWRLLPEDDLDQQVHVDSETGLALIADVRLDYPAELAASLGLSGAAYADSYLVFAAYLRWGERCVEHLHGDFAFVAWEAHRLRLVMARDFLGGRPLFFHAAPGKVMVASLPQALAAVPGVCSGVNQAALVDRLALVAGPPERTLWQNISRLPPGYLGIVNTAGVVDLQRWWDPRQLAPVHFSCSQDYVSAGRELFEQAVRANLRTRGRVGAQLSAGLDSGGVATTAARHLAARGEMLDAYTFRPLPAAVSHLPANWLSDESVLAAEVAQRFTNIRHHLVTGAGRHLLADLDAWTDVSGEPLLNPINMGWIYAIHEMAKGHGVSVLLTGILGNLTLTYDGGHFPSHALAQGQYRVWGQLLRLYSRYAGKRAAGRLLLRSLLVWLLQHGPRKLCAALAGRLRRRGMLWHGLRDAVVSRFNLQARYAETWRHDGIEARPDSVELRSRFLQMLDIGVGQKAVLARYAQDMRNPLVNRRLVEFCLSIPDAQYCQGIPRSLARRIFADRLPESVCQGQNRGVQGQDFHLQLRRMLPELQDAVCDWEDSPELVELLDIPRFSAYLNELAACDDSALARQNTQVNAGLMRNIAAIRFVHRTLARLRAH